MWDDASIAAAQRIIIAHNMALRLVYQTWWTWWLPRFAVIGIVGGLAAEGLNFHWNFYAFITAFLLLSVFGEYWAHRSLGHARARAKQKGSTTSITMSDEGIDIAGAYGSSHLKWKGLHSQVVKPDGILILFSNISGLWLPDTALAEGTPGDVRELVAANNGP